MIIDIRASQKSIFDARFLKFKFSRLVKMTHEVGVQCIRLGPSKIRLRETVEQTFTRLFSLAWTGAGGALVTHASYG